MTIDYIRKKIKELRIAQGYSLRTLANKSGLSQNHIWEIENGYSNPSLMKAAHLANSLGVTLAFLCDENAIWQEREREKLFLQKFIKLDASNKVKILQLIDVWSARNGL